MRENQRVVDAGSVISYLTKLLCVGSYRFFHPEMQHRSRAGVLIMNQVLSADTAMARAIECASYGLGKTFPNPIVGAVITSAAGEFISEGYHQGAEHAEVGLGNVLPRP